uniref:Uncharacterized protein n=1 Tax=Arundo donax TaxID=35708 RepID=A0A0A8ZKH9_ARUDO
MWKKINHIGYHMWLLFFNEVM